MKKFLFILIIFLMAAIAGCHHVESEETVKIIIETPYVVSNTSNFEFKYFTANNDIIFMPVKSFKILENIGNATVSLVKANKDDALDNFRITNEYESIKPFIFTNRENYSSINFRVDNSSLVNYHDIYFTNDVYVKLELELYKDEICPELTKIISGGQFGNPSILYFIFDPYSGNLNHFHESIHRGISAEEYSKKIDSFLNSAMMSMYENYIKHDNLFLETVEIIRDSFKSEKDLDKAYAIYDWIVNNISFSFAAVNENYFSDEYNENSASVYNAIRKKESICFGYAYLFDALARYFELESYPMLGIGGGEEDISLYEQHAWNIVILEDDKLLNVDTTFGATDIYKEHCNHFNLAPNEYFSKHHQIWSHQQNKFLPYEPKL